MLGTTAVVAARTGTASSTEVVPEGLSEALQRAQHLADTEPGPSAELFGELARELERASFAGHAGQLRIRQRDLLASAGQNGAAFAVAAELLLDRYEDGDPAKVVLDYKVVDVPSP